MYNLEKDYWWFVGKRFLVKKILKKYCHKRKDLILLDVGCGTGINMKVMGKFGKVFGVDISKDAIFFCKKRGLKNIYKSGIEKLKFKNNSFDVVTSLDVLYHKGVKDDIRAMKELHRVLKPGGCFVMTDAAMKCLESKHDIVHHVARRYSKRGLMKKLIKAGFIIEKVSYFNTFLFPFVYLKRKLDNLLNSKMKSDVQEINPLLDSFLKIIYKSELRLLDYVNYPFGVSILAVCKK
jgi:ubiquinone/menaquinone biosynthesis C-methylase UbiE